ncbi:MAG: hypothetical protein PBU97_01545 [Stenotrophomonas maltophilia]
MSPFINTAWPRFFMVALPIAAFGFLSSSIDASPRTLAITPPPPPPPPPPLAGSFRRAPGAVLDPRYILGLWLQRLRKAHAEHPILKSELPRVATALIGNVKLAALWFGLTFVGMFALMLAWVLLYKSCG